MTQPLRSAFSPLAGLAGCIVGAAAFGVTAFRSGIFMLGDGRPAPSAIEAIGQASYLYVIPLALAVATVWLVARVRPRA